MVRHSRAFPRYLSESSAANPIRLAFFMVCEAVGGRARSNLTQFVCLTVLLTGASVVIFMLAHVALHATAAEIPCASQIAEQGRCIEWEDWVKD